MPMDFVLAAKQLFAGGISGCVAKTAIGPLDRTKILLQAHHPYYKQYGVVQCMLQISKREGFFSLWKGNTMMMIRIFPYAALQFFSFEHFKSLYLPLLGNGHVNKLVSGSSAGVVAVLCTYPLDMVRARLAFQITGEHRYESIKHAFTKIYKNEGGLKGFYSGINPTIVGMIPYAGVSFYAFNALKETLINVAPQTVARHDKNAPDVLVLKTWVSLCCGGFAGAISQTVSFPFDVARRRMQLANILPDSHKFRTMWTTLKSVYIEHGIYNGLYRGLSINYIRVVPQQAVAFTVYEFAKEIIGLNKVSSN